MINLPFTTAMMIIICNFSGKMAFFKVIPETGYIINWGDFKSRCGSWRPGCWRSFLSWYNISVGIYKAGPSCLKADSLLTQVFFLLFKMIFSRNFLCYFKSIQSSTCWSGRDQAEWWKSIKVVSFTVKWKSINKGPSQVWLSRAVYIWLMDKPCGK